MPANEAIVYIARKLKWSRKEIGELTPTQFNELVKELQFQEAQEQYCHDYNIASILAAIYNTIPSKSRKVFKPQDFLRRAEPKRQAVKEKLLEELAKEKGIKLPRKSIRKPSSEATG